MTAIVIAGIVVLGKTIRAKLNTLNISIAFHKGG